jgi:hypothetical protein
MTHGNDCSNNAEKHLAVLIDADNAQSAIVEGLLAEIAKYGVVPESPLAPLLVYLSRRY